MKDTKTRLESYQPLWSNWYLDESQSFSSGSFGDVYKFKQKDYGIYSAVKVITMLLEKEPGVNLDMKMKSLNEKRVRAENEIRAMYQLESCPYTVHCRNHDIKDIFDDRGRVIGFDVLIQMNYYVCLEKKLFRENLVFSEIEVIKLGTQIGEGLRASHALGIIHRDIKPANIFIGENNDYLLGDYGISKQSRSGYCSTIAGTPEYMAPEVYKASSEKKYEKTADICSLGLVMYTLLNNNYPPFTNEKSSQNEIETEIDNRLNGKELVPLDNVSDRLNAILLKSCRSDPHERYQTIEDFLADLATINNSASKPSGAPVIVPAANTAPKPISDSSMYRTVIADSTDACNNSAASNQKVNTFGSAPKKKSKRPNVIAAVLAVVLLVGVGFFAVPKLFGGVENIGTGETSGDISFETSGVSSDNVNYSKHDEEQIANIISEAEALASQEDYEGALVKVQNGLVTYPKSAYLQNKADEYAEELNGQIRTNALATADVYATNGDYLSAFQTIKTAMDTIGEDTELTDKAQVYEDAYVSNVVPQIDAYILEGNFDAADRLVSETLKSFPNNTSIMEQQGRIENSKPQNLLTVCQPYQTTSYNAPTTFKMAGTVYTNGFTLASHGGTALFNLNRQYSKLEFDLGYTDSNDRADCNVNIYLDGQLTKNIVMSYEDLPQHIVVSLNGVSQLKIENVNYGNMAKYGFANAVIYKNAIEELSYETSETSTSENQYILSVCPPYQTTSYNAPATFKMAGTVYSNGFTLDCHGGTALFNLNGQYSKLEFDLGYTDSNDRSDCNVNIYLDGQLAKNIVMSYEDLPQHIVVSLNGASQLKIENVNYGNMAVYGFANAVLS